MSFYNLGLRKMNSSKLEIPWMLHKKTCCTCSQENGCVRSSGRTHLEWCTKLKAVKISDRKWSYFTDSLALRDGCFKNRLWKYSVWRAWGVAENLE